MTYEISEQHVNWNSTGHTTWVIAFEMDGFYADDYKSIDTAAIHHYHLSNTAVVSRRIAAAVEMSMFYSNAKDTEIVSDKCASIC